MLEKGGRTGYHGKVDAAVQVMRDLGFPKMSNSEATPDYLLDVVSGKIRNKDGTISHQSSEASGLTLADRFAAYLKLHLEGETTNAMSVKRKHFASMKQRGVRSNTEVRAVSASAFGTPQRSSELRLFWRTTRKFPKARLSSAPPNQRPRDRPHTRSDARHTEVSFWSAGARCHRRC